MPACFLRSLSVVWRRRADSNRRIEVLQTSALDHLATSPRSLLTWCRGRDLNPHRLCLPPPQDGVSTNSTTSAAIHLIIAYSDPHYISSTGVAIPCISSSVAGLCSVMPSLVSNNQ